MPRWPAVHPELIHALRFLDAIGMPYAEAWRMIAPVAARLGVPRPSYWWVRRFLIAERRKTQARAEQLDRFFADMFKGVVPLR